MINNYSICFRNIKSFENIPKNKLYVYIYFEN